MSKKWKSRQISLHSALATTIQQIGGSMENRALNASLLHISEVEWLVSVRLSTRDEDARGIDLVFETSDIGNIFIQIKSSLRGVRKFMQKKRSSLIEVIIVKTSDSDDQIWKNLKNAILKSREKIFILRG